MQRNLLFAVTALSGLGLVGFGTAGLAQMHKVAKPEDVVRAVGVYEWTGDRAKPTASRLIPVTLFIDGSLQDAGVYLARPVPFALDSGTVYEIDQAGKPVGTLDVQYATHLQAADAANYYDDGWFGYGSYAPPPAPKKVTPLKPSKTLSVISSSKPDVDDPNRPTLVRRHPSDSSSSGPSASGDSGTPVSSSASSTGSSPQPPDDPDRPHLSRRADSSTAGASGTAAADQTASTTSTASTASPDRTASSGDTGSVPASDPDRPTLKKRTPEEAKKARREAEQSSATGLATSLNDDPNRPTLHHGKGQQALTEADLPKLKGVPVGLHQAVAVSDAKNRPEHDFSRPWADDAERATVLAKMQVLARAQLAAYQATTAAAAAPAAPAATGTKAPATAPVKRTPNSKLRHGKTADSPPPPEPLEDEQLNGYTLSYGGAATYVYMAHTAGEGAALRYVTVVAQMDAFGELRPAIQSVTDAAHLDRTPWMRLVDVVDVEASNRASLLFELRGQSARQFALYRVIAARADQTFLTGTTQ